MNAKAQELYTIWKEDLKQTYTCTGAPVFRVYPLVSLNEEPDMDDNIFEIGEPLTINAKFMDMRDNKKDEVPIDGVDVYIYQPDGSVQIEKTDNNGNAFFKPKAEGKLVIAIPELKYNAWINITPVTAG